MIFADLPVQETEGALLAHSIKLSGVSFKKGRRLSAEDVAALVAAGRSTITVARLEPGDLGEDAAAARIAAAAQGPDIDLAAAFTGRCNLLARTAGVLIIDRDRLDRINLVDEAITIATLPPYDLVEPRQMVATIKIIPFAVSGSIVDRCEAIARDGGPLIRVAALRPRPVALIQTRLPGLKDSLLDKTVDAMSARLVALGCGPLVAERRCDHTEAALAAAINEIRHTGAELLMILGASAITDRRDVIPASIERAGGRVDHFGMPVDPGNLLLLAQLDGVPVLGLPGCARSPKLNGFDWVLQRLIADIPVGSRDIMLMGAGGLLKEIPTRPQPRAGTNGSGKAAAPRAPRIGAIVLAAGRSSRMGAANKLLTEIDGVAMAARAVETALTSQANRVVVVTGHDADRVRAAVETAAAGRPLTIVHNGDYAAGISASLKRGLTALETETNSDKAQVDGALICLADMPRISPTVLNRLIAAFNPNEGRAICVPVWNGKRGNPVLWARRFFPEMTTLAGDVGARHLIGEYADLVCEVAMSDDSVLLDIDTPEALAALSRSDQRPA